MAQAALRRTQGTAPVAAGVPLHADPAREQGRQAHRPPRRQRAAHRAGGGDLPYARHRPLRAAGQAGGRAGGSADAWHRAAGGPGNRRSGPGARALRRTDGRPAQGQEPQRADGRATTGRQRGARHHDARSRRSRRPGFRRHPHHRQHHPPRPAADQDRTRLQPGVVGVLHAAAGPGGGLRRLRGEPRPVGQRPGGHRHPERRLRPGLRHSAAGGDDQLLHRRVRNRRRCRESAGSDAHRAGKTPRSVDRWALAV
ncbi:hypothetical protein D9M71_308240 [compost metagenome]